MSGTFLNIITRSPIQEFNLNDKLNIQHARFYQKATENDSIIYKLIRNTLTHDPKGRDDPQMKIPKSVEEAGAGKSAQNLSGYQILSLERNPAKRTTPVSPERPEI